MQKRSQIIEIIESCQNDEIPFHRENSLSHGHQILPQVIQQFITNSKQTISNRDFQYKNFPSNTRFINFLIFSLQE